jgi:hypothetical protein
LSCKSAKSICIDIDWHRCDAFHWHERARINTFWRNLPNGWKKKWFLWLPSCEVKSTGVLMQPIYPPALPPDWNSLAPLRCSQYGHLNGGAYAKIVLYLAREIEKLQIMFCRGARQHFRLTFRIDPFKFIYWSQLNQLLPRKCGRHSKSCYYFFLKL